MTEQKYIFIDKTGHCFEDFQLSAGTGLGIDSVEDFEGERYYRDRIGAMLRGGEEFTIGDMMCFKQDLLDAGFKWGIDFYVRKA